MAQVLIHAETVKVLRQIRDGKDLDDKPFDAAYIIHHCDTVHQELGNIIYKLHQGTPTVADATELSRQAVNLSLIYKELIFWYLIFTQGYSHPDQQSALEIKVPLKILNEMENLERGLSRGGKPLTDEYLLLRRGDAVGFIEKALNQIQAQTQGDAILEAVQTLIANVLFYNALIARFIIMFKRYK